VGRIIFKKFKPKEYAKFDYRMAYQHDKLKCIKAFNVKYGTSYKYISEAMQKMHDLGLSLSEIGKIIDNMTPYGIYCNLKRMKVKSWPRGGARIKLNLSPSTISAIRDTNLTHAETAEKYKISMSTAYGIRKRINRWAKL
jgi:hypothetical protein